MIKQFVFTEQELKKYAERWYGLAKKNGMSFDEWWEMHPECQFTSRKVLKENQELRKRLQGDSG